MPDHLNAGTTNSPTVLVTGATGALGPSVVEVLRQAGYAVRVYALDPPGPGVFAPGIEVRIGDINDKNGVNAAIHGVDQVVHMAALLHALNPDGDQIALQERVNVEGTRNVVDASLKGEVRRLVFFSTIAVYGESGGRVLSEDSIPGPKTLYARTKAEAEQIVLGARLPDGSPLGCVIRLAAVYGSRVKGNYLRLLNALARNRFVPIGSGLNKRTLVYDKDVANATLAILESPMSVGKTYNVTDGNVYSLNDIVVVMCEALGRKPPRLRLPLTPLRLGAEIMDKGSRLLSRKRAGLSQALEKYIEDLAVSGWRIQDEIGFKPKYDLLSGWNEAIEEMRARGEL